MVEESPPLIEDTMTIDGLKIGYCKYGHGPKLVLCICGAVGSYKKDWPVSVLKHFDPDFVTIICIDPPGYGTSRPPDRVQEVNRCKKDAAFCLKLMENLKLTPFTVIGWSEGGRTAMHVAAQGGPETIPPRTVLRLAKQHRENVTIGLTKDQGDYVPRTPHGHARSLRSELVYDFCGGRFPCDYVLPKITVPSLIMNGGQDRFCADPKTCFLSVLKNARLEVHAQGGHDFYIKYPKWFSENVQKFLRED
ncbi:hydrolase, alpha/beta domain protein [Teladorsagia circumcincta]|uniref:Hydrolase, alpha/beta domain protein n=1 Tax=Teladorsagia circumcincta TaxID=45464 RepID=A0A2G9TV18_TELCI|nr:hydrolase, alpha/beta domain protein [Teladorsagia circumcincta]